MNYWIKASGKWLEIKLLAAPPRNFKNLTLYSSDDNLLGVVEYTKNKQGIKKVLQVNDDGKNIVYYRREYNRCFRKVCEKSDKILQEMETFIKTQYQNLSIRNN